MIDLGIVLDKADAVCVENAEVSNYQVHQPIGVQHSETQPGFTAENVGALREKA